MKLSIQWAVSVPLYAGPNGNYSIDGEQLFALMDSLIMRLQRHVNASPGIYGATELTVSVSMPEHAHDASSG